MLYLNTSISLHTNPNTLQKLTFVRVVLANLIHVYFSKMPNLFHSSLHKYIPGITTKAQRSSISAAVDQSVMHIKYKVVLVAQWATD